MTIKEINKLYNRRWPQLKAKLERLEKQEANDLSEQRCKLGQKEKVLGQMLAIVRLVPSDMYTIAEPEPVVKPVSFTPDWWPELFSTENQP